MQLLIRPLGGLPQAADGVEIVERKGIGHPDTICDALAERLSVALCRYYLEHFDLVLHHNVDKVLLRAGVSRPAIGGGEIVEPMEVFLAGRASLSFKGVTVPVAVNAADDPGSGRIYITVTGTSAECGDDGEAGRGNRANGLITPFRPMALEAVAGKNPITHVGKLDNVAAGDMAAALVEELPEVLAAQCVLVSQIGRPVTDPQIVAVHLRRVDDRPLEALTGQIRECVGAQLEAITTLWERMIREEVSLY